MPGKHLSQAKSFLQEESQSRRGPRQRTREELQKTLVALQRTQMGRQQTRTGQPQKLRMSWRALRMAEDQRRPQCPRGLGRQLGGHRGGLPMP